MENAALLILLESVLGQGHKTSRGNYSFKCPFCTHHKNKLEINCITNAKSENPWHCWVCEAKGKTVRSLFKSAKIAANKVAELNMIISPGKDIDKHVVSTMIDLPEEFIPLAYPIENKLAQIEARHAVRFLRKRGITHEDIMKYNIGF